MKHLSCITVALVFLSLAFKPGDPVKSKTTYSKKIDSLVEQMTLEEEIAFLHGNGTFFSAGLERLNIPELHYADGPLGIREELERTSWNSLKLTTDSATFFPNGSALAATWNPDLIYNYGKAMGEEARARNKDILLAPAINITRTPLGGRTYEYMSEDPYLNSRLVVASVKGIQSQNVAACIKHFAVNNQETARGSVNVMVDERALREIYLPAFKAGVMEANSYTVMAAYNKVRGQYCAENDYLLNKILRDEWSFKGFVMSDWGGTHSTVASAKNGLDVEMGSRGAFNTWYFAKPLLDSVKAGLVDKTIIDEKVRRILWVMMQTSMSKNRPVGSINTPAHNKVVYDIASEAIVLLKNDKNLLPLKASAYKNIAVIGDNATHKFATGGFGAGVKAQHEVTSIEGLKSRLGTSTNIVYAQGYKWGRNVTAVDTALMQQAVAAAKSADAAILFVGANRDYETEGTDRKTLQLPYGQQSLITAVTNANPNTIVVLIGGAPYDINEIKRANHTIVFSWFNGSEGGNALADVLIGKVNPSGKLPFTFPKAIEESPAHALQTFPGTNGIATYKEGILVGYRWFDTKNIEPLYPFGYGLSYTSFTYTPLVTDKKTYSKGQQIKASLKVRNTGKVAGKETVQLYVSMEKSAVPRAQKELKAFKKVIIAPGKDADVNLTINVDDLSYFDEPTMKWKLEPGTYKLFAGSSSRDIRQVATIQIN